ncbi:MAG TPA: TIGR00725 family protein [Candidatus Methanofastidiosa archaeon]|nr:TIGR00725 family protein [Candidatus Methanofastidiosa archaeon]
MQVSVIGSSTENGEMYRLSHELGRELANKGHSVICGGKGGIMEAVSKGVHECGGLVVGILPDDRRGCGNRYLSAEIVTGIKEMRNLIVVLSGDVIVAFPGSYGTVSEMSFAMRYNKKMVIVRPDLHKYLVDGTNVSFADDLVGIMNKISELHDL